MLQSKLSAEIVDEIASYIDEPTVLLSFSLSCRYIAHVIIPRHTDFRIIRCPVVGGFQLWSLLARDKSLAKNVRHLHIVPLEKEDSWSRLVPRPSVRLPSMCPPPRAPVSLQVPPPGVEVSLPGFVGYAHPFMPVPRLKLEGPEEFSSLPDAPRLAERILIKAIKNMHHLISFEWTAGIPLPCINSKLDKGEEEDIWTSLASIDSLKNVSVMDRSAWMEREWGVPILDSAIWKLSGLHSFKYEGWSHEHTNVHPDLSGLCHMLHNTCPELKTLDLSFGSVDEEAYFGDMDELGKTGLEMIVSADNVIRSHRWEGLNRLRLYNVEIQGATASAFLISHPTLTHLDVQDCILSINPAPPPGLLPNLQFVACSSQLAIYILSSKTTSPRPISHIEAEFDLVLLGLVSDLPLLRRYKLVGHTSLGIREVEMLSWNAPQLEWLELSSLMFIDRRSTNKMVDQWIDVLARFPRLNAFHSHSFFYPNDDQANDEIAAQLMNRLPNLRRLDSWHPEYYQYYSTRDQFEDGQRIKARYIALSPGHGGVREWEAKEQDDWRSW